MAASSPLAPPLQISLPARSRAHRSFSATPASVPIPPASLPPNWFRLIPQARWWEPTTFFLPSVLPAASLRSSRLRRAAAQRPRKSRARPLHPTAATARSLSAILASAPPPAALPRPRASRCSPDLPQALQKSPPGPPSAAIRPKSPLLALAWPRSSRTPSPSTIASSSPPRNHKTERPHGRAPALLVAARILECLFLGNLRSV